MLESIVAGDTLAFTKSLPAYPATAGWSLAYRLVPRASGGTVRSFSSTASGDDHVISVAAATTATWAAGWYGYAVYATQGSVRYSVESGQVEVLADPAVVAAGADSRSHAAKMLDALEATLQGRATGAQLEYRIGDRMLKYMEPAQLEQWRDKYKREVAAETRTKLGIRSGDIFVRLGRG